MLNIKNLTLLSPKKVKKMREFWPRLQKKSSSARFFLQPSVAFCSLSNESNLRALALLLIQGVKQNKTKKYRNIGNFRQKI